jgi:DNA-directed RNA polymerase beta' subunit
MIGSKLIPASAILSAIITQLRKYQNNSIVAQYTFGEVTDSPKYEIEKPSENEATSAEAAANQIKITYKIDLNLNDILIMARNSAENFV